MSATATSVGIPIVPPDDESIYLVLTSLATSDPVGYQAIVRPNNPPPGIGGFLFDIPGEEELRLQSKITSYFLERNSSVQDSWALLPITITLRGTVGELTLGLAQVDPVTPTTNQLPLLPAMQPPLTDAQQQAQDDAQEQQDLADTEPQNAAAADGTSPSLYQYYTSGSGMEGSISRQAAALLYFKELWSGQQLVSVETPWGIVENCAILDLRATQNEKTRDASDFVVIFQEVRFAGEATVQAGNLAGRTALQLAPTVQNGNAGQTPTTAQQDAHLYAPFGATPPGF